MPAKILDDKTEANNDETWDYVYNSENRQAEVQKNTSTVGLYTYNALGNRVKKVAGTVTEELYYDGADCVGEKYTVQGESPVTVAYVTPALDKNMAMTRGNSDYYYTQDGLGSVRELIDTGQVTKNSYDYEAFGSAYNWSETVTNSYTYTARVWDSESKIYDYRSRKYSTNIGRFISRDFLDQQNLYTYVINSPIVFDDPYGLQFRRETGTGYPWRRGATGTFGLPVVPLAPDLYGALQKKAYEAELRVFQAVMRVAAEISEYLGPCPTAGMLWKHYTSGKGGTVVLPWSFIMQSEAAKASYKGLQTEVQKKVLREIEKGDMQCGEIRIAPQGKGELWEENKFTIVEDNKDIRYSLHQFYMRVLAFASITKVCDQEGNCCNYDVELSLFYYIDDKYDWDPEHKSWKGRSINWDRLRRDLERFGAKPFSIWLETQEFLSYEEPCPDEKK